MSKKNIKIFVSHRIDLDSKIINNDVFIPIRCGDFFNPTKKNDMIGDDTGKNISYKNYNYCEFTGLYWAWKNQKADYYGLCHYRRYFSFSNTQYPEDEYGNVVEDYLDDKTIKKYKLDDVIEISRFISFYDYIFTKVDVSKQGYENIYEQYSKASKNLHIKDLMISLKIIKENTPSFYPYAKKYFDGNIFYPCVMFVMRKDIFEKFCEWVFPLMEKIEKELDLKYYNVEESRVMGHIGERLLGVYITYLQEEYPQLTYKICQRLFFWNTKREEEIKPAFEEKNIPLVISSSDYYIPYLSVALRSMMLNASKKYNYDINILCADIHERHKRLLCKDLSEFENQSIRFIDVSRQVRDIEFKIGLSHISKETFYRLLIPDLMKAYDKIIFLDSDLIVKGDISELYDVNLEGNPIGATIDVDFAGEYKGAIEGIKEYTDETLELDNPFGYFQAGVVVMDLNEINKQLSGKKSLLEYANGKDYRYLDQDILNVVFAGKVKYLDLSWNVLSDCDQIRINKIIKNGPMEYYHLYLEARKNPNIIHFAGDEKPWDSPAMDYVEEFFSYARESVFYECIMLRLGVRHASFLIDDKKNTTSEKDKWIQEHMGGDIYSRFIFPWKAVKPGARIILYGGGIVGKTFLKQLANNPYCHVMTVVDRSPSTTGIVEAPVVGINELAGIDSSEYDLVLIALERKDIALEVRKDIELMGIPTEKIKWVDPHRR